MSDLDPEGLKAAERAIADARTEAVTGDRWPDERSEVVFARVAVAAYLDIEDLNTTIVGLRAKIGEAADRLRDYGYDDETLYAELRALSE